MDHGPSILNSCAGNFLFRRKQLVRPSIQSWLDGFEPLFWCGLFSERCCKVAWSMVFMLFQNDKFDAAVISRKCLGCRKLGPCYPGSTTAPWQTRQRFWQCHVFCSGATKKRTSSRIMWACDLFLRIEDSEIAFSLLACCKAWILEDSTSWQKDTVFIEPTGIIFKWVTTELQGQKSSQLSAEPIKLPTNE